MAKDDPEIQTLLDQAEILYSSLLSGETTLGDVACSKVGMARMLIKADRTGSWLMHLQAVSNCLSVFAAAGHFSYLRSAHRPAANEQPRGKAPRRLSKDPKEHG